MDIACITVVAGIVWQGPRYLATQRPPGSAHAGFWEFPGGKVEAGESLEEALVRELDEELGIVVLESSLWQEVKHEYADPPRRVHVHFFHVKHFAGEPSAREGQQYCWVLPKEAQDLPFLEADRLLVQDLAQAP